MSYPPSPEFSDPARDWHRALQAGPDCPPLDAVAVHEPDTAVRAHLEGCVRCQIEHALFLDFAGDAAGAGDASEAAAVAWVAEQARQRVSVSEPAAQPVPVVRRPLVPAWAMAMAAVLVAAVGLTLLQRPAAVVDERLAPGSAYRSESPTIVAPSGELDAPPTELRWDLVARAVSYRVSVTEVDGAVIWTTATAAAGMPVPAEVQEAAQPARTLVWRVEALDDQGRRIGDPATATFRVRP